MKILLVAEESAGVQVLRALSGGGWDLIAVLTSCSKGVFRGATVEGVARHLGLPVWPAALVKDPALGGRIREEGVDILLNIHSLFIFHPLVLESPRIGCFNLHPGPLPGYAGLNAPGWAIYRGERRHAVTLHWMRAGIDTGPIAYQASFDLGEDDTGLTVSGRCVTEGLPLVETLLHTASRDPAAIPARAQDPAERRYYGGRAVPHGGRVSWSLPARELVSFIRAADYHPLPSPWGHPRALFEGCEIGLVKASLTGRPCRAPPGTVGPADGLRVEAAAGDEWVALGLIHAGNRYLPASEFLKPGARLEDGR